ncbi:hypothetical protein GF359_02310 [candidate division WOR-3 bacterium]|uniref:WD40 repeat domain-containing protein n=1 Tax=candidate division WOR-3 bacterium TaxID=2052148 RepID=A0A9D5K842_UNCW3|nr:hypothetical protein [candidate division WOR-3 bacterium]MBD3364027.1 hypothetical protein [candidate division WOR-3 bacterium]
MLALVLFLFCNPAVELQSSFIIGGDFTDGVVHDSLLYLTDGRGIRVLTYKRFEEKGFSLLPGENHHVQIYKDTLFVGSNRGVRKLPVAKAVDPMPDYEWLNKVTVSAMLVTNDTLLVADRQGTVYLHNLAQGGVIDSFTLGFAPVRMLSAEGRLFLACDTGGLWMIDLQSGSPGAKKVKLENDPPVLDILEYKNLFYLACAEDGLRITRLKRNNMKDVASIETPGQLFRLIIFGDILTAAAGTADFLIFSLDDPQQPVLNQEENVKGTVHNLVSTEGICYLIAESGITRMNILPNSRVTTGLHYATRGVVGDIKTHGKIGVIPIGDEGVMTFSIDEELRYLGYRNFDAKCERMYIFGSHVYTLSSNYVVHITDIKDPSNPKPKGFHDFESLVTGLDVAGEMVLVAEQERGLGCWWRCPCGPLRERGRLNLSGRTWDVRIRKKLAFVSTSNPASIHTVDWSDSTELESIAQLELDRDYEKICLYEDYLYALDNSGALGIFKVSRPTRIKQIGHLELPGSVQGLAVSSSNAYVAAGEGGVYQVDLRDPTKPELLGSFYLGNSIGVALADELILVATPYAIEAVRTE